MQEFWKYYIGLPVMDKMCYNNPTLCRAERSNTAVRKQQTGYGKGRSSSGNERTIE